MTFKIGQTVARQNPGGGETIHQIKTDAEVKYHNELRERGYKYSVLGGEADPLDFDLPTVEAPKATAPRVHMGGSTCTSCEG